jgi:hypothetical protein
MPVSFFGFAHLRGMSGFALGNDTRHRRKLRLRGPQDRRWKKRAVSRTLVKTARAEIISAGVRRNANGKKKECSAEHSLLSSGDRRLGGEASRNLSSRSFCYRVNARERICENLEVIS